VIASPLAKTNLVTHVKQVHLELAAGFQAVTLSAFAAQPTHPWRRLLDPFIHRSIQVTNPNLDLLFEPTQAAGQFTLAPLPVAEQLRLLKENAERRPASIKLLHMDEYATARNMGAFSPPPSEGGSGAPSGGEPSTFFWRWHYRARTVQGLYTDLIECWIDQNYPTGTPSLTDDPTMQAWWLSLQQHMPSVARTLADDPAWLSDGTLTREALVRLTSTIFTWVSWIHEDVGHSASYLVYNPTLTPMQVASDGVGIPLNPVSFNTDAYRTFVFLERARLLDPPPDFWFSAASGDRTCYVTFQDALRALGANDSAFSECGRTGFYSCVEDVETAVSS